VWGLNVLKGIGFIWVLSTALSAIYLFPPVRDIWGYATLALFVITPLVATFLAGRRVAFAINLDNIYLTAGYLALSFLVFEFTVVALVYRAFELYMSDLVYIIAVFGALVLIGVLNEDIPVNQLAFYEENGSVLAVTRGLAIGSLLFLVVYGITSSFSIDIRDCLVGYLDNMLATQFEGVAGEFLFMLFFVAIPEEFLARVFFFNVGSNVVTAPLAGLLMITTWYALHGVTRYFLPYGSLVLFVITLGGLVLLLSYGLYGFLSAVFTHAIYNTLIDLMVYYGSVALGVAVVLLLINFLVARYYGVKAL
jgi:hypothetical protein